MPSEPTAFGVARQGLYYVPCGPDGAATLHLFDSSTGQDHLLGKLDRFTSRYTPAISVSPDGATILYHRVVSDGADLHVAIDPAERKIVDQISEWRDVFSLGRIDLDG